MENLTVSWTTSSYDYVDSKVAKNEKVNLATLFFTQNSNLIAEKKNAFVVVVDKEIFSIDELFRTFNDAFRFPYFGFNWDALLDCLRDLDWINANEIILYHDRIPNLNEKELGIYLEILCYAVSDWIGDHNKSFKVFFKTSDYLFIKNRIIEKSMLKLQ